METVTAAQIARERDRLIQAEIALLENHAWAGQYYKGDGLGENSYLSIAPSQGYVFEMYGCLGLYDRNYGSVTAQGYELYLQYTFSSERRRGLGLAPRLVPVTWGTRRYLVASDEMIPFCNSVNSGAERLGSHQGYFLRRGDPPDDPVGLPKVPEEFDSYLLRAPIDAQITSIGQFTTEAGLADTIFVTTPVTIDAGSDSGLLAGMELVVLEPPGTFQTVEITELEQNRSEGKIVQIDSGIEWPTAFVGSRLSTRNPLYDRLQESRGQQE